MSQPRPSAAPANFDPVAYINDPDWHTSSLGLHRIRELLQRLGNPQQGLRFVHVAGTNGKGSTCAFTARILQEADFKTGLFTSPYVVEFAERIQVDGTNIAPTQLLEATLLVREQAEAMHQHPTEFELMTAVALLYFARQACDIVVCEVGLGGRLDSTNVIDAPEVCAICPIALDHTDILGTTQAQIAAEKAGIIKAGASVVVGVQTPEALEVLQARARAHGCQLVCVDEAAIQGSPRNFSYKSIKEVALLLQGSYQVQNAALACEVAWALRARGFDISDAAIAFGLASKRWPARFELVCRQPDVIVDGGHNAQGAAALVASLEQSYPGVRPVFIMGVLADKDYPAMIAAVAPLAEAFVCVQPPSPRALLATTLAQAIQACSDVEVYTAPNIAEGVRIALQQVKPDGLVCAFGSLYSVEQLYRALGVLPDAQHHAATSEAAQGC